MRFHNLIPVAMIAAVVLTGCNSNELTRSKAAAPCTPTATGEPRRVTPAEVKTDLENGTAILIDVRGEATYKSAHIKGSKQIPYADIANHSDELPRDKLIVTYCS